MFLKTQKVFDLCFFARREQPIEFTPTAVKVILDDEVPVANLNELEKLIMKSQKSHGVNSLIKKQIKSELRSIIASDKMRLKSLTSLKCPRKGKCKAELEDVQKSALEETSDKTGRRIKMSQNKRKPAGIVACMLIFPCAVLVLVLACILFVISAIYVLGEKIVNKITHKESDY